MPVQLNHTIVWSKDRTKSARFLATLLGLPEPAKVWHFDVVQLDNGVSLDFADAKEPSNRNTTRFLLASRNFARSSAVSWSKAWFTGRTRNKSNRARSIARMVDAAYISPILTAISSRSLPAPMVAAEVTS